MGPDRVWRATRIVSISGAFATGSSVGSGCGAGASFTTSGLGTTGAASGCFSTTFSFFLSGRVFWLSASRSILPMTFTLFSLTSALGSAATTSSITGFTASALGSGAFGVASLST